MCDKCDGTGLVTVYEMVPYGMGNVSMPMSELCTCLESGRCPGCDADLWEVANMSICCNCKRAWNEDCEEVK